MTEDRYIDGEGRERGGGGVEGEGHVGGGGYKIPPSPL